MYINSRLFTYLLSLSFSFYAYMLFSVYMVFEDISPRKCAFVDFYCAIIVFAFLSWFQFYKRKLGALLLTILVSLIIFIWLIILVITHLFLGPRLIDSAILICLSGFTIAFAWIDEDEEDINKYVKLILSVIPFAILIYFFGYMIM
jgi:hypothetical protein